MEKECHGSWPSGRKSDNFSSLKKPHNNNNNHNNSNNKEQDRFLPIANVGRIMKKVIPGNGKISKDAKESVQECVSEFISFVTGEASDKCQREKRKTINGDDVIWAITTLGFEDYVVPLKFYLNKYRDIEGDKVNNNVPSKQQRSEQEQQQQQQQQNLMHEMNNGVTSNLSYDHHHHHHCNNNNVYSSSNFIGQPTFLTADQMQFPMPFSPGSVQKQIPHEQQIDSVGHW